MNSSARLRTVRLAHTIVWAFVAGCILAIPFFAWRLEFGRVLTLAGVVLAEILVLIVNRWRCPLTDLAARYTDSRRANFDIYLPEWLARNNKMVFGLLFGAGLAFTLAQWFRPTR
ncbi:MAG: hypothetical protein ABJD11_03640 [Gemmatimonadota bacterium]